MFPILSAKINKIILWSLIVLVVIGGLSRFYQITQNQFFYYDEGMWLNEKRTFVVFMSQNPPQTLTRFFQYVDKSFQLSLTTAKSLWMFICMLRVFFTGAEGLYFVRIVSALSGFLTIGMTFLFARRFYNSFAVGLLSAVLIAWLPSHVFYSRLALQESFTMLCFLSGLYLYLFPRKMSYRPFLSGILFAFVFFANYRMIIIPVLIAFVEVYISVTQKQKPHFRKYVWNTITFLCLVFFVGAINKGANTFVTFSWMFHQSHLAQGHFSLLNLMSYPYYIFRLESLLFGLLFIGNFYFLFKKEFYKLFPFVFVVGQMILFSLPQEKGTRYLCAAMPFMVMSAAYVFNTLTQKASKRWMGFGSLAFLVVMLGHFFIKDLTIIRFKTDYQTSIHEILWKDKTARFISTQPTVQRLYVPQANHVIEAPKEIKHLISLYGLGYRYLILDPQAFISFTKEQKRFSPYLLSHYQFIRQHVRPLAKYDHFHPDLLERFVLEHNEDLAQSIKFLKANEDKHFNELMVYDLQKCLVAIRQNVIKYQSARDMVKSKE